MSTLAPAKTRPLTRRLMATFSRWKDLDSWGRTRMPGLHDQERQALADLEHNFERAGSQARWFTGDENLKSGVLPLLLDGFELTEEAIPDLVRCARVDGPARKASLEKALRRWLKHGPERPATLGNQTAEVPREAPQAPARDEVVALRSVPTERLVAPRTGTPPGAVIDRSATVAPPVLAPQNRPILPAIPTHDDPFETGLTPASPTVESAPMTSEANPNGAVSNGRLPHLENQQQYGNPLITKPGRSGVKEQVEEWIRKRGIDLEQSISQEIREELAAKAGTTVRTVRWAIEELRRERGITMHGPATANAPGRSLNDLVLAELRKMGFTLHDELPSGTVKAIAQRLQVKATAAQSALHRMRTQVRKSGSPPAAAAEPEARAAELNTVENPTPAEVPAPAQTRAPVVDEARAVVLKLAGKVAETDNSEAHLRVMALLEKVL